MKKAKILHFLGPLLSLFLFSAALWVLHRELRAYHLYEITRRLGELPASRLLPAVLLTYVGYFVMTGYDFWALRYVRHPLSYGKILLASFIAYAFSNNMGFSMLAGSSVRYRLYSAWDLSALEITKVVAFCSLSFWLGFCALGGVVFLVEPMAVPQTLHLPFASVRPLGLIFLGLVSAYFLWSVLGKKEIRIRGWEFLLPSTPLFLVQVAVASLDWALAGAVLYVLLPPSLSLSYPGFLGMYMLAQAAGLVSQVPGGLGVFETVMLLFITPELSASEALGALLAYRAIYYLFPLGVAAVLLGAQEVIQRGERFQWFVRAVGQQVSGLVPNVLAFTTFVAGATLLFSGAMPNVEWRLEWLEDFFPLEVMEISHFLGSLAGMGLLLLAFGLKRRLDAAYIVAVVLLVAGTIFSLLKGLDYEEAIALSVILGTLLPCRRHFYRKASLFSERFDPGWIGAIILVVLSSVWLGIFSYKHVEYSGDLWWRFTLSGNAPRFLRATVGVIGLALFFGLARLLRSAAPKPAPPGREEMEKVSAIVGRTSQTYANLAFLGDKEFLFSQTENAFIMYAVEGRSWVAMGDPVGPVEEATELVWRFRETCDPYDGWPVFYEVGQELLPVYLDMGLVLLKLGEEARVPLADFSLQGSARKGLRYTKNKLEKEGCSFEMLYPETARSLLPELKVISDAWLAEKNTREKSFSLGSFDMEYLGRFPVGIIRRQGKIVAFANVWQGGGKEELSVDLMRYLPQAPHDVMEYLFLHLMLWGKEAGYLWFNLGMAPFSGIEAHALAPLWNRLGAFIFSHGEHFYNFQGLRRYKEKFDPEWNPKYLASPGGMALPRILANLGSLISGGLEGVVTK